MNRPELYRKTVDILYQAYFNDTLEHGKCVACAVGNIIRVNIGASISDTPFDTGKFVGDRQFLVDNQLQAPVWALVFMTMCNTRVQDVNPGEFRGLAAQQIAATGYPWQELAKIEYAFETANKGSSDEDYMFNGLVSVLEVLKELHKVDDNSEDIYMFQSHRLTRTLV